MVKLDISDLLEEILPRPIKGAAKVCDASPAHQPPPYHQPEPQPLIHQPPVQQPDQPQPQPPIHKPAPRLHAQAQSVVDSLVKHNILSKGMYETQTYSLTGELLHSKNLAILRGALLDEEYGFASFCLLQGIPYFKHDCYHQYFSKTLQRRYNLFMIPRGLMKTTLHCAWCAWYYVYSTVSLSFSPRTVMLHSDVNKAQENLRLTADYLSSKLLLACFPDMLQLEVSNKNELLFDYDVEDAVIRKESHFVARSMWADLAGQHFTIFYLDDLCTADNTRSVDSNEQVWDVYKKLPFLDDHSGYYKVVESGTAYTDDCHHAYVVSLCEEPTYNVVVVPAENDDNTYNFPDRWNAETLRAALLEVKGDQSVYQSQLNQRFYKRDNSQIQLLFSMDNIVDEASLPNLPYFCITAADPAFSVKNKRKGDAKSRATILTARFYPSLPLFVVCGLYQSFGEEGDSWTRLCAQEVSLYKSRQFIQDAQGTQQQFFMSQVKKMREFLSNHQFFEKAHTKSPLTNTNDKMEVAANVLNEMFKEKQVLVLPNLKLVVDQFLRKDPGYDIIDCMVYIVTHASPHYVYFNTPQLNDSETKSSTSKIVRLNSLQNNKEW